MTDASEHDDLQKTAEETSRRIQPDDPYTEPPNSTVDDWLGQRVDRDMDAAPDPDDASDAHTAPESEDSQGEEPDAAPTGDEDPDSPGAFIDDGAASEVPEPNEPG
jgi:hypothetical protein